jgi:hypothetical protein
MSSCKNPTDYIRKNQRHVEYIGSYRTDFDKMYLAKYAPDDMRVVRGGMPTRVGISDMYNEPVGVRGENSVTTSSPSSPSPTSPFPPCPDGEIHLPVPCPSPSCPAPCPSSGTCLAGSCVPANISEYCHCCVPGTTITDVWPGNFLNKCAPRCTASTQCKGQGKGCHRMSIIMRDKGSKPFTYTCTDDWPVNSPFSGPCPSPLPPPPSPSPRALSPLPPCPHTFHLAPSH